MMLLPINPKSVPAPGRGWMESVTGEETHARIMLTVVKMVKSAVLMAARRTVLSLVSNFSVNASDILLEHIKPCYTSCG